MTIEDAFTGEATPPLRGPGEHFAIDAAAPLEPPLRNFPVRHARLQRHATRLATGPSGKHPARRALAQSGTVASVRLVSLAFLWR